METMGIERQTFVVPGQKTLVALRVGTALAVLTVLVVDPPWLYGHLPSSARVTLGRELIAWVPTSTAWVALGSVGLTGCCIAVGAGWRVRLTATAATTLAVWVLGVPQLFTAANHYHHVVWLMALIALSGGGTARKGGNPEWWVRSAILIVGCVYFIPGMAKAFTPNWFSSDNLYLVLAAHRLHMDASFGFLPPRSLAPWLAVAAVAFELGFLAIALTKFRRWIVAVALIFHLLVGLTAGIWFWFLFPVLGAFLLERPHQPGGRGMPPTTARLPAYALIALVWIAGGSKVMDAWPFAAYPLFTYEQGPTVVVTEVLVDGDLRRVGEVLLPDAPLSRHRKIERRDDHELEDLIYTVTGQSTEVRRREVPITERS